MKRPGNLFLTAAAAAVFAVSTSGAAFVKFDGVDGEATDKDHKGWIDVLSLSQTIHRPWVVDPATGARRRGGAVLEDIVCSKELDKSTPKLAEALLQGEVFPKVEIHMTASYTDAGRVTYYSYELTNVQVTSYSISGATQAETRPTEQLSLNFEEIKVTYTEYDASGNSKGNVETEWKVEKGE